MIGFWPLGKQIIYGGGAPSTLANIIWLVCCGILMALMNLLFGFLWCITIVGIPFGKQFFKIAKLALSADAQRFCRPDESFCQWRNTTTEGLWKNRLAMVHVQSGSENQPA